jgi:hypothetical protein
MIKLLISNTSECVKFFLRLLTGDIYRSVGHECRSHISDYCHHIIAVIAVSYFLFSLLLLPSFGTDTAL